MLSPYRTPRELHVHAAEAEATSSPVLEELGLTLILGVILLIDLATFSASGVDAAIGVAALFVGHQAIASFRRPDR